MHTNNANVSLLKPPSMGEQCRAGLTERKDLPCPLCWERDPDHKASETLRASQGTIGTERWLPERVHKGRAGAIWGP